MGSSLLTLPFLTGGMAVTGSDRLAQMAMNHVKRRSLDIPIAGEGGFLGLGSHNVKIIDVDLSELNSRGCVGFKFENESKSTHSQLIWIMKKNVDEYSGTIVSFINAVFQDPSVYEVLDELMVTPEFQEGLFQAFRGMYLQIIINRTPGTYVEKQGSRYAIVDFPSGQVYPTTFQRYREAKEYRTQKKWDISFSRIDSYGTLNNDILTNNRQHLDNAIEGMYQAAKTVSNPRHIFEVNAFRIDAEEGQSDSS